MSPKKKTPKSVRTSSRKLGNIEGHLKSMFLIGVGNRENKDRGRGNRGMINSKKTLMFVIRGGED